MRTPAALALLLVLSGCAGPAGVRDDAQPPTRPATSTRDAHTQPAASTRAAQGTHDAQPRQAATTVRVAVAGDIACPPGLAVTATTCHQGATARLIRALDPARVIAMGDTQYEDGRLADYRSSYDRSWGTFKGRTLPVIGNHEYRTAGAKGFYAYFGRTPPAWWATNVGSWRIYLLNSNCGRIDCDREETWLRRDLEAHPHACSAITMHHPRYSSGLEHGSDAGMARFWTIAYRHHVDLALAGHDHDYERFAAMDGYAHLRSDGLLSFVVGTGGRSLYEKGRTAPGSRYYRADRFGVLLLTLGKGAFSWGFHVAGGGVRDTGSHRCH